MSDMKKTIIGYFDLKASRVFRNTFSYAAWYEDVDVPAGQYPIELLDMKVREDGREEFNREVESYINGAYISMDGTIVSDYFAGHYFGVPISDYDTNQNAGKSDSHHSMVYLYEIARSILKDKDCPYHLNPEYEAREITFISCLDNKPCTTYGIFRK